MYVCTYVFRRQALFIREWWQRQPAAESVRLIAKRDEPRVVTGREQ